MTLSASKRSPLSCVLNSLTVKPALEKHVSEEADVQRSFEASCLKGEVENLWITISRFVLKRLKSLHF